MRVVKIDQGTEQIPDPQIELDQLQLEHPLVLVIWRDAFFDFDQSNADDIRPDYLVHTVGFLLAEGPILEGLARKSAIPLRNQQIFIAPPDIIIKLKQGRLSDKDKSDIAGLTRMMETKG